MNKKKSKLAFTERIHMTRLIRKIPEFITIRGYGAFSLQDWESLGASTIKEVLQRVVKIIFPNFVYAIIRRRDPNGFPACFLLIPENLFLKS